MTEVASRDDIFYTKSSDLSAQSRRYFNTHFIRWLTSDGLGISMSNTLSEKNRPKITVWVVLVGSVLHADPQELIPNFKDRRSAESQIIKFHIHMSVHLLSAKHTPQPILTQHWTFMQPGCCRSRNKGPWNPHKRYEFRANTCSH